MCNNKMESGVVHTISACCSTLVICVTWCAVLCCVSTVPPTVLCSSPQVVETYDPHLDTWSVGPTMAQGLSFAGCSLVDREVYLVGGAVQLFTWVPGRCMLYMGGWTW